jgi:tRNA nucleotidyltransferase (CCA-adding enzyme)
LVEGPVRAVAEVEDPIRRALEPTAEFLRRVSETCEKLVAKATSTAHREGIPLVRAVVAGSAARGTYLTDRLDIDLFLLFPPELPRAELERHGLALGGQLFLQSERRYAEHPYLRGQFDGFSVDAVPGYAVTDPSHPLSAVDRTPFHNEFLLHRQNPEMVAEVRLTKQFLRAMRVYGSEARTQGFSGYLVELLLLKYGTLDALLKEARGWHPPVRITYTPGSAPRVPPELPLVLDDPVDPGRNVSSALSMRNFATFVLAAQAYLDAPSPRFFRPPTPARLSRAEALERVKGRGTHVAVLTLPRPELVDDIIFPQLQKAARALGEEAARLGFLVTGSAFAASDRSVTVLLETEQSRLPEVKPQDGPPAGVGRVDAFLAKWLAPGAPTLQGPFVTEEGRLAIEVRRPVRELEPALTSSLERLSLGRDLVRGRTATSALYPLEEAAETPELATALSELLDKRLPWLAE